MQTLEELQAHFRDYVWKHVLSMLLGLMLLKETKTLIALQYRESLPTLSRTLNHSPWAMKHLRSAKRW
jgi:hypothetical protein